MKFLPVLLIVSSLIVILGVLAGDYVRPWEIVLEASSVIILSTISLVES